MNEHVHWHEGLFLRPHHLQLMQRQLMALPAAALRLAVPYPYGVVEARLNVDALQNGLVRFDRLRVVMPGGVEVDAPDHGELPALDIRPTFESSPEPFTIWLGVPHWYAARANVVDADGGGGGDRGGGAQLAKRVYRVDEVEVVDENSGEDAQPVQVRRVNARLLLPGDDRTDLEVIPLLRVGRSVAHDVAVPRQEPTFLPPTFLLAGAPGLRGEARNLANQVAATRKGLVEQMKRGGFDVKTMAGLQLEQALTLRTLNRYAARLPALVEAPAATPFALYVELRSLLAELAALYPAADQFECPAYNHDDPAAPFDELFRRLRGFLKPGHAVVARALTLDFSREGRVLVANLTEEHLTKAADYLLGVTTRQDPNAVIALVENADTFKLMPKSLATMRIRGVRLSHERVTPAELPQRSGLLYFRLDRGEGGQWARAQSERALSLFWPGMDQSDFECKLYMPTQAQE